jgi:predicted small lipoprotein YifL
MKRRLLIAACAALAAGGCGQKGPLYLPDKNAKVVTSPAASGAPAPPGAPPAAQPAPQMPATAAPKKKDQDGDSPAPK